MSPLGRRRWCVMAVVGVLGLVEAGCTSGFYLSESEVAAYRANLRTAASATDLLDNLPDHPIEIEFDSSRQPPRIVRTNFLEVLRGIPELYFLEQAFRQIRLDRLSRQLEEQLDAWLVGRLDFLRHQEGSRVRLTSLQRAIVRFRAPPAVSYDASQQAIHVTARLRLRLQGTIEVSDPGGLVGALIGHFLPDGLYPVTVVVEEYRLAAALTFARPVDAASRVAIQATPEPRSISVIGNVADNVKDGIRQVVAQKLAAPLKELHHMRYDHFLLTGVGLATGSSPGGPAELRADYRSRPAVAEPLLDVVVRSEDGQLHHSRRRGGRWGDFKAVPGLPAVASEPALVASGPDQLELVAVAANGELVYSGWRGGAWGNAFGSRSLRGWVMSPQRPAVVATAPGQLEVVAVGDIGILWHLRRLNGRWLDERSVLGNAFPGALPFRDLVMVQAGSQLVLFYADSRDSLFAASFDLESGTWAAPRLIAASSEVGPVSPETHRIRFAPAAASCGSGRVDLVYVRPDQAVYHKVLTLNPRLVRGIATEGSATRVGGVFAGSPSLTCTGDGRLELVGPGEDGKLVHNAFFSQPFFHDGRLIGAGWQGWEDASERLFGTVYSGRVAAPVAAGATRSGQVHVAARAPGASARFLFHNSLDSARAGAAPWKAVHWRGFQRVAAVRFTGAPALAVSDRQVEIAGVADDGYLWRTALTDDGVVEFTRLPDASTRFPGDPVVVSSGPGALEFLFLQEQGGIGHVRRVGRQQANIQGPTLPPGRSAASMVAAATSGIGQLEAAVVTDDRAIYHWRYRSGSWEPPTRIGGPVISAPILAHVGAGQLELLAVGQDQRLYRAQFANGQWTRLRQIPGDFPVNAVLFGPQGAASWGDGALDVIVVEGRTGRLFHTRMTAGGVPTLPPVVPRPVAAFHALGGQAADIPMLHALGPTRLTVIVRSSDDSLHENSTIPPQLMTVTSGLPWHGFERVGRGLLLGGVAHLGDREYVAVAVDPSGGVHVSRFAGWRWAVFAPVVGSSPPGWRRPVSRPGITRH